MNQRTLMHGLGSPMSPEKEMDAGGAGSKKRLLLMRSGGIFELRRANSRTDVEMSKRKGVSEKKM